MFSLHNMLRTGLISRDSEVYVESVFGGVATKLEAYDKDAYIVAGSERAAEGGDS